MVLQDLFFDIPLSKWEMKTNNTEVKPVENNRP